MCSDGCQEGLLTPALRIAILGIMLCSQEVSNKNLKGKSYNLCQDWPFSCESLTEKATWERSVDRTGGDNCQGWLAAITHISRWCGAFDLLQLKCHVSFPSEAKHCVNYLTNRVYKKRRKHQRHTKERTVAMGSRSVSGMDRVELVPWDARDAGHIQRMVDQRIACTWGADEVDYWSEKVIEGGKYLYWIVSIFACVAGRDEAFSHVANDCGVDTCGWVGECGRVTQVTYRETQFCEFISCNLIS